jgi:hypothetical protein
MITDYHAKLFAHELIRRCPAGSVERFTPALPDSRVNLPSCQVEARLSREITEQTLFTIGWKLI